MMQRSKYFTRKSVLEQTRLLVGRHRSGERSNSADTAADDRAGSGGKRARLNKRAVKIEYETESDHGDVFKSESIIKDSFLGMGTSDSMTNSEFDSTQTIREEAGDSRREGLLISGDREVAKIVCIKQEPQDCGADTKDGPRWEPVMWRDVLANIREMRTYRDAPVDTMGCTEIADVNAQPEVLIHRLIS